MFFQHHLQEQQIIQEIWTWPQHNFLAQQDKEKIATQGSEEEEDKSELVNLKSHLKIIQIPIFLKVLYYTFKGNHQKPHMKVILLIACLLLVGTQAITVGSCQKFSLDGQRCQECVNHFHLYEGNCFVDILGCQSYTFGNICHSCENGYILVNNLCCDHNCLAKLFKRHESTKVTKTISQNFKIFNKIIPFVNQHYIKNTVHNLVEIEEHGYIDVIRYVILYEFPNGRFKMRRAVVDVVRETEQIVMVDWTQIQSVSELMDFHKDQVKIQNKNQINRIMTQAFPSQIKVISVKQFTFTQINQYEIVGQDEDVQSIIYQTFYVRNGKKLLLIKEDKPMPQFVPTQTRIQASSFEIQTETNADFSDAIQSVRLDSRYRPNFHHAIVKHSNRFIKQYIFYIENDNEEIEFFLLQNLRAKSVKIIDYVRRDKPKPTPIVSHVLENIEHKIENIEKVVITEDPKLTPAENKVAQIVLEAVKTIQEEKKEQKPLSDCRAVNCDDRDAPTLPIEEEQMSIVKLFREMNPQWATFELVETWQHKFRTFTEWTILVVYRTNDIETFIYFHALEFLANKKFKYWGQEVIEEPLKDKDGKYAINNPQQSIPEEAIPLARNQINAEFPEATGLATRSSIIRSFPGFHRRYIVVLRHNTKEVRYVVLNGTENMGQHWVQEYETIQEGLEPVTAEINKITEIKHQAQIVIEQISQGKPVQSQTVLQTITPVVIEQKPTPVIEQIKPVSQVQIVPDVRNHQEVEVKIVEQIRQNNPEIKNIEIVEKWTTPVENGQRQTYLVKQQIEQKSTEPSAEPIQKQIIEYHTVISSNDKPEIVYVGNEKRENVIKNEEGVNVEPEKLIKLADQKVVENLPEQQVIEHYIRNQIVEKLQKTSDVQQVSNRIYTKLQKFVFSKVPEIQNWELKQTWTNNDFKTYIEYTLLFSNGKRFIYVYVFEFFLEDTYTFEGTYEPESAMKNGDNQFVIPNPQHNFEGDSTQMIEIIKRQFPEVQQSELNKVIERVFPEVHRYIIILRAKTTKLRYVIHLRNNKSVKIVEWDVIEKDLPVLTKEIKAIQKIVQESIVTVQQEKNEQKPLSDCRAVNCDDRDAPTLPIEEEQMSIVKLFREMNPQWATFELVETWQHKFRTFTEWTILVVYKTNDIETFIYFHALEFLANKKFKYWGQEVIEEPLKDKDGKYAINNPQQSIPEEAIPLARNQINAEFPESTGLATRSSIIRSFPGFHRRYIVVLRHNTKEVRYVVLNGTENMGQHWVQEYETIQEGLEPVTAEINKITEIKHKMEVIASQIQNQKPIEPVVDLSHNTQIIQVKEQVIEVKTQLVVDETTKTITKIEQPLKGSETILIKTMKPKEEKIIKTVTKLIKTKFVHHFSTHEVELLESTQPLTVIEQEFCKHGDYILIYEFGTSIFTFAFRLTLTEGQEQEPEIEFLGKFSFPKEPSMTTKAIIDKATAPRATFDTQAALSTIVAAHGTYNGLNPISQEVTQMGDFLRGSLVFKVNRNVNRFLVSGSQAGQYDIIEECLLEETKEVQTEIIETVTNQVVVVTTDVQNAIKEDATTKEVVSEVISKVTELEQSEPTKIAVTEFTDKTQYVVEFTKTVNEEVVNQQVTVVHDKVQQTNEIIGVEQVPVVVSQPVNPEMPTPVLPLIEEKYVVIENPKTETTEQVQKAIIEIVEQVTISQDIPKEQTEVKEILIKQKEPESPVQNIQIVVENKQTHESILVDAVANVKEDIVVIEETKVINTEVKEELATPVRQQMVISHPTNTKELQKLSMSRRKKVQEVDEMISEQIKHETVSQGSETILIKTMKPKEEKIIKTVTKLIKTKFVHHFSTHEVELLESTQPLTVIEQEFCKHGDYILIYEFGTSIFTFAFRLTLTEGQEQEPEVEFLGKFSFPKEPSMTTKAIIDKATAPRATFDTQAALSTIVAAHGTYNGLNPISQEVTQMGDFLRGSLVFKVNRNVNRFLVSGSQAGQYDIIEECLLEETKEVQTEIIETVTNQVVVVTTDVQNAIKEDATTKEVVSEVISKVTELEQSEPTKIAVTEFTDKTQYVVEFTKTVNEEVVNQQVTVVHDKVQQTNEIIGVEQVPVVVSQPVNPEMPTPVLPLIEEKYVVIENPKTETTEQVQKAIIEIVEQVTISQDIPKEQTEVKEILIKQKEPESPVQNIQIVVENKQTHESILVDAVANVKEDIVVIEETKVINTEVKEELASPVEVFVQSKPEVTKQIVTEVITPQTLQKIVISVQQQIKNKEIQGEVCSQIEQEIYRKELSQPKPAAPTEPKSTIVDPVDIKNVITEIKQLIPVSNPVQVPEVKQPAVKITEQQIVKIIQQMQPSVKSSQIVSTVTENLPNSVLTHVVIEKEGETTFTAVLSSESKTQIIEKETVQISQSSTIETVIKQIQQEDKATFEPVDPLVTSIAKATIIVESQPVTAFETKIDIAQPEQKIQQVVEAIRTQYPITESATVISASQTKISSSVSEVKVDFFVPAEDKTYKVDEAKVQINTQTPGQTYTVTSLTEVVNNGVPTNVVLEKTKPEDVPNIINAAYGYEKISSSEAKNNPDIIVIEAEIQRRYSQFVAGETVSDIESLQLKNGKVNYIFRYKKAYFTIYWDSLTKRIIFLNEINLASRNQFSAVKDLQLFKNGVGFISTYHSGQMKEYKILSSGQYVDGNNVIFQLEFLSGNKKYRSIFQVNKESMDIYEIMFTELIEISMKDNNLKDMRILTEKYVKIDSKEYKSNRYLLMVDQFIKNRNPILKNARIIGAGYKPQNLGFNYKLTYKTENSKLLEFEVYFETFSQKYTQTSVKQLDFLSGFSSATLPNEEISKILKAISSKTSIGLVEGQYSIQHIEVKEFFFGCIFRITVTINGADYEGLIYYNESTAEINLLIWRVKISGDGCEAQSVDRTQCVKCGNGFIASSDGKSCVRQISGCEVYGEDKLTCNACKIGYELVNNVCTKDCGALCMSVAFP